MNRLKITTVEDVYCSALRIEYPSQRNAFLNFACGGDPALRLSVDKLHAAQPDVEDFFREAEIEITSLRPMVFCGVEPNAILPKFG